ncbi:hypothetical protein [Ruegeria sp. MALMAid1280]|uniref:hypothetical protein n=1 Tax=Ruegeria sp. MALMAid1280 TaxID=3411634 RepID=UPI003BA0A1EA
MITYEKSFAETLAAATTEEERIAVSKHMANFFSALGKALNSGRIVDPDTKELNKAPKRAKSRSAMKNDKILAWIEVHPIHEEVVLRDIERALRLEGVQA